MKDNPYFSHKELACPATGVVKLAPQFIYDLVGLRKEYNRPMIVNSCCRSAEYNKEIGGHPRSLHIYDHPYHKTGGTCAIDIKMTNPHDRAILINIALSRGWSVGVNNTFIHLDRRNYVDLDRAVFLY